MAKCLEQLSLSRPKNILFLTYYFPPDLSAGSFRAKAILESMLDSYEVNVQVLTTLPNRYSSYTPDAQLTESAKSLQVKRIPVPMIGFGVLGQAWAFLHYAIHVLGAVRHSRIDLVFATSSRMMTAVLGALVAKSGCKPLYLDIRDLLADAYPDTQKPAFRPILKFILGSLEKWTFRQASKVNLNSPGFVNYFIRRFPDVPYSTHTNGVDDIFLQQNKEANVQTEHLTPLRVLYAGNVGEGQDLENVLPALAARLGDGVHFRVVGDGASLSLLIERVKQLNLLNVEFSSPVSRDQLLGFYASSDVLFLHLNKRTSFEKVLPSKIFEYAATGKPIWAGLIGYSAEFVRSEVKNARVFPSGDVDSAVEAFGKIRIGHTDRREFIDRYSRANISQQMAKDILSIVN